MGSIWPRSGPPGPLTLFYTLSVKEDLLAFVKIVCSPHAAKNAQLLPIIGKPSGRDSDQPSSLAKENILEFSGNGLLINIGGYDCGRREGSSRPQRKLTLITIMITKLTLLCFYIFDFSFFYICQCFDFLQFLIDLGA